MKKLSRWGEGSEKRGINLVQSRVRINSPRTECYCRGFHVATRRNARPLWREQNLERVLPSRKVNRQHSNAGVRLVRRVRWQGRIISVTDWLRCTESGSAWRVDDLDLQLLRADGQICHGAFRIDSRVRVHPPLDGRRSRNLILQQNLCPLVQRPDTAKE